MSISRTDPFSISRTDPFSFLKSLNYHVISAGDSYNDTTMLLVAKVGFLIHAPDNVKREFPQFKAAETLPELPTLIEAEL